jgi:hypothetical protein
MWALTRATVLSSFGEGLRKPRKTSVKTLSGPRFETSTVQIQDQTFTDIPLFLVMGNMVDVLKMFQESSK